MTGGWTNDWKKMSLLNLMIQSEIPGCWIFIFELKEDEPLDDALEQYCDEYDLDRDQVVFMVDGEVVEQGHTPEDFNLQEGDYLVCGWLDKQEEDCHTHESWSSDH